MTACLGWVGSFSLPQLYINVVWWRFGESLCGHGFDSHQLHHYNREWTLVWLHGHLAATWGMSDSPTQRERFSRLKEQSPVQPIQPDADPPISPSTIHLHGVCRQSAVTMAAAHFFLLIGVDWIWRQRSRWSRGLQADNRQSKNRFSGPQRHACRSLSVGTTKVQPFTEKSLEGFILSF